MKKLKEAKKYFQLLKNNDIITFPEIIKEFLELLYQHKELKDLKEYCLSYLNLFFKQIWDLLSSFFKDPKNSEISNILENIFIKSSTNSEDDLKVSGSYFNEQYNKFSNPIEVNLEEKGKIIIPISHDDKSLLLKILHLLAKSFSSKNYQIKLFILRVILKIFPQDLQARLEISRVFTKKKLERRALKILDDLKKVDQNDDITEQFEGKDKNSFLIKR